MGDELWAGSGAGQRSKDAILDAAEQLMGQRGYAGTSMSAICAASGLPPSSVYWHFGSKQGVLEALLERTAARLLGGFGTPGTVAPTPAERLDLLLDAVADFVVTSEPNFRFLLALGQREGPAALTTAVLHRAREHMIGWVRTELRDILGLSDRPQLAEELAVLVVTVAIGVQVGRALHGADVPFPAGQLAIALTTLAEGRPPA